MEKPATVATIRDLRSKAANPDLPLSERIDALDTLQIMRDDASAIVLTDAEIRKLYP